MTQPDQATSAPDATSSNALLWLIVGLAAAALMFVFRGSLIEMEYRWQSLEQYSHGYMIPMVALFLLYKTLPTLRASNAQPSSLAPWLMVLALIGWCLGELSSLFIIVHYSFFLAVIALFLSLFGLVGGRISWAALLYLIFMIPLPGFILKQLSAGLQLISTELGVAVIRLMDITVFAEGNVIDLGEYQLQVVEACSGLNYLFPLMSFGFLIAVIYKGPQWHRWLIFLATIPITVLMNSLRIGIIGITVEYWGIEAAEGFLHTFEGWFVFMACLAMLSLMIYLLNLNNSDGLSFIDRLDLDYPSVKEIGTMPRRSLRVPLVTLLICLVAVPASIVFSQREEIIPPRKLFTQFPLLHAGWIGRDSAMEANILDALKLTDYVLANYYQRPDPVPVNLYIAYYESQRTGAAIHSPRSCIPGGGWQITNLSQLDLSSTLGMQGPTVNRTVIALGEHRQLVYYWFDQRGRTITNEYLAKWYLFQDGLTLSRSDGALVRLVTPIPVGTDDADADARLQTFLRDFYPLLIDYVPGKETQ